MVTPSGRIIYVYRKFIPVWNVWNDHDRNDADLCLLADPGWKGWYPKKSAVSGNECDRLCSGIVTGGWSKADEQPDVWEWPAMAVFLGVQYSQMLPDGLWVFRLWGIWVYLSETWDFERRLWVLLSRIYCRSGKIFFRYDETTHYI